MDPVAVACPLRQGDGMEREQEQPRPPVHTWLLLELGKRKDMLTWHFHLVLGIMSIW